VACLVIRNGEELTIARETEETVQGKR
jgi:hypothetical protein